MPERGSHPDYRIHNPFKEQKIGNEQVGQLLAAVGNHEAKALLLLMMQKSIIYTTHDLYKLFKETQGSFIGWEINSRGPGNYCKDSLAPIGLVAEEVITSRFNTVGYMKTRYGETIGDSFAGHMLAFSERYPSVSLQQVFGKTASHSEIKDIPVGLEDQTEIKKRSPAIRLKILQVLASSNLPLREVDIMKIVVEDKQGVIEGHLVQLSREGIIQYSSAKHGQPQTYYKLSPSKPGKKPEQYLTYQSLSNEVYELFLNKSSRELSIDQATDLLIQSSPGMEKLDRRYLEGKINQIINSLEKQGFLHHVGKFKGRLLSEITLFPYQKNMLVDLVNVISRFQTGNNPFLQEGLTKGAQIVRNPRRISALLKKAKEASPHANRNDSAELSNTIYNLLTSNPEITTEQIQAILDQEGIRLTAPRIRSYLSSLRNQKMIESNRIKGVNHWTAL